MDLKVIGNSISVSGAVNDEMLGATGRLIIMEDFRTQRNVALCFNNMREKAVIPALVRGQPLEAIGDGDGEISSTADGAGPKIPKINVHSLILFPEGSREPLFFV